MFERREFTCQMPRGVSTSIATLCAAVLLLLTQGALLAWSACLDSPTLNEPGHLVAGLSYWRTGCFRLFHVNPPLVRLVASAPVKLQASDMDWPKTREVPGGRSEFEVGARFIRQFGEHSQTFFIHARWSCIPFCMIGGWVCFSWARALYGNLGGLFALTSWCFCPSILGHGHLITTDVAGASLIVAAAHSFWMWMKQPTWWSTLTSGIVMGLAELTKMTAVVLVLIWPTIWLICRLGRALKPSSATWSRELSMLAVRTCVAVWVVNLGYLFEGSFTHLGDFQFVSTALRGTGNGGGVNGEGNRFAGTWLESIPVPLPRHYLEGIDTQQRSFEDSDNSYIRGEFRSHGWWYYYLYSLLVKLPLAMWCLIFIAAFCTRLPGGKSWRDEFPVVFPALVILAFVSSQSKLSEHMRYAMPVIPFACIWTGRAPLLLCRTVAWKTNLVLAIVTWMCVSSLATFPHSLSYFSELVGGPLHGPEHLINSNVDWGQDLLFLRNWMRDNPTKGPIHFAYLGLFDARDLGIEYIAPKLLAETGEQDKVRCVFEPGYYAISASLVRGLPWHVHPERDETRNCSQGAFAEIQAREPVAYAGYSIYIYYIEPAKDTMVGGG